MKKLLLTGLKKRITALISQALLREMCIWKKKGIAQTAGECCSMMLSIVPFVVQWLEWLRLSHLSLNQSFDLLFRISPFLLDSSVCWELS
jgi:hypothetical protein